MPKYIELESSESELDVLAEGQSADLLLTITSLDHACILFHYGFKIRLKMGSHRVPIVSSPRAIDRNRRNRYGHILIVSCFSVAPISGHWDPAGVFFAFSIPGNQL